MSTNDEYFMMDHSFKKKCRILDRSRAYSPVVKGEKWFRGKPFVIKVNHPLEARLQPFNDMHPDMAQRMSSFMGRGGLPIWSDELIATMQRFGVDNLDCYDLDILDPDNGEIIRDYKVVNIIGVIAAADMENSLYTNEDGIPRIDVAFDELHIDLSKTHGQLIFRLAENLMGIIVHSSLKNYLIESGFSDIDFHKTTESAL